MAEALENPAWVDRMLARRWQAIAAKVGDDFMPVPAAAGGDRFKEHGCGYYGCVFPTGASEVVFKVTSDPTEAAFVAWSALLKKRLDGVVRYHGAWRVRGEEHEDRPVFVLVREGAEHVGDLAGASDRESDHFVRRLVQFKDLANVARRVISRSENRRGLLARVAELADWSGEQVDYGEIARMPPNAASYPPPEKLYPLRGAQRVAWALRACRYVALEMAQIWTSADVGEALGLLLDEGCLLADVHYENVGIAHRTPRDRSTWVVTDPGQAVFVATDQQDIDYSSWIPEVG